MYVQGDLTHLAADSEHEDVYMHQNQTTKHKG